MADKMTICIVDSFSYNIFHEIFNASLLVECMCIADKVYYYACRSATAALKGILSDTDTNKVCFRHIPVVEGNARWRTPLRFLVSAIYNFYMLLKIKHENIIIYNSNNIFSTPLINGANRFLNKKIVVFCHGELEAFNKTHEKSTLFWRIINEKIIRFFTNKEKVVAKYIIFFVLGDNIKKHLMSSITDDFFNKFYSVEHPYIPLQCQNCISNKNIHNSPLNFGLLGTIRKGKNIAGFICLLNMLKSEIQNKTAGISVTGQVLINRAELESFSVDMPPAGIVLNREEYNRRLMNLDHILFFYDKNTYQFTASGPFMDALFWNKPIISLRNDYFEYMFKKYGEFGILVDSIEEMAIVIRELINGKLKPQYRFDKIKEKLLPEKVAVSIENILKESGLL
jgi:hypothetical protein